MSIEAFLGEFPGDPDLSIVISAGNRFWGYGEITLSVHGDGAALIRQQQGDIDRQWRVRLDEAHTRGFCAEVGRLATRPAPPNNPREPEDLKVRLSLEHGSQRRHALELWYGDREWDPAIDAVVAHYEAVVAETVEASFRSGPAAAPS